MAAVGVFIGLSGLLVVIVSLVVVVGLLVIAGLLVVVTGRSVVVVRVGTGLSL